MKIYDLLNPEWQRSINKIQELAKRELDKIVMFFPDFSDHSYEHSEKLIQIIERLLPEKSLKSPDNSPDNNLSIDEVEKFLILAGCYLHDLGMVPSQTQIDQGITQEIKDEIRKNHHKIIRNRLKENKYNLDLDHHILNYLGDICYYHRGEEDLSNVRVEVNYELCTRGIRLQFICTLVRLADECHLTFDRVQKLTETYRHLSEESKKHFLKHYNTSGMRITDENLEIAFDINTPRDKEIFENMVKEKVEKEFQRLRTFLRIDNLCKLRYIQWQLNETGVYKAITIDEVHKEIIKYLLSGERTYEEIIVFLTEKYEENYDEHDFREILREILRYLVEEKYITENNGLYLFPQKFSVQLLREYCRIFSKNGIIDDGFFYNNHFQELLESEIFNTLVNFYNCKYTPAEKPDRIELLKDFPSILYFSLFGDQNVDNYGLLNCERLLDAYFLLGMLVDSVRNPILLNRRMGQLSNCSSILEDLQKKLPDFHSLLIELTKLMNLSMEEVNRIFFSGKEENIPKEKTIEFTLRLKHKACYSHLTFPYLSIAYHRARLPFMINDEYIENIISKDIPYLEGSDKSGNMTITMMPYKTKKANLKIEGKTTCNLIANTETERALIRFNSKCNFDFKNYPFGVMAAITATEMNMNMNMNMNFGLDLFFMEPRDYLRLINFIDGKSYREIKFIDGETGDDIGISKDMEMKLKNIEEEEKNTIRALALFQERVNKSFPLPITTLHLSKNITDKILDIKYLQQATDSELEAIYEEISYSKKPNFIITGIVLYNENLKMTDYYFFAPTPGNINFKFSDKQRKNFIKRIKSIDENIDEADINNLLLFEGEPFKVSDSASSLFKKTIEYIRKNKNIPGDKYYKDLNGAGESYITYFTDLLRDKFWEKRRLVIINIFSKLTEDDIKKHKYRFMELHDSL